MMFDFSSSQVSSYVELHCLPRLAQDFALLYPPSFSLSLYGGGGDDLPLLVNLADGQ
jgi:hypothetical protein